MKPIKSQPRYRCDFCRRTSTKAAMERHERICWKNPNRFCENCNNRGYHSEHENGIIYHQEPCYFCSQRKAILD